MLFSFDPMRFPFLLSALTALLLSGSACTTLQRLDPSTGYWRDINEPGQVMAAYVSALMEGELDRAAAYLYLPVGVSDGPELREQLARISNALKFVGATIRVADTRSEQRVALVLYTTDPLGADATPVFLLKDVQGRWRLHHKATAGPLQKALRDRNDVLEVRALAGWGAKRMAEINREARHRLLSRAQP
jgi:hypothetical protein